MRIVKIYRLSSIERLGRDGSVVEPAKPIVLLVDDDARNRALVRGFLRDRYEILEAETMGAGLRFIDSGPIDLVLLDVMMPGEHNGYEGCRLIKNRAQARDEYIPVILVTALGEQEDRNRGLEAGADDFLTKPINPRELKLRVRTFLQLRRQERLLHEKIGELKTADGLKDDLVSLLVHDLRNPLGGLTSMLDFMSAAVSDENQRANLELAVAAGDDLREILEDMLHVRQSEAGALDLTRELVDTDLVLADAIASISGTARAREVRIARLAGKSHHCVQADKKLVKRAMENLLSNAVKYSPPGAEVSASVTDVDGGIEIIVSDRGCGVPEAFKSELFKKFGSVEAARGNVRRGFGLGLHMVNLVATAHGGRALVRDREGGGTVFGIFLPRIASRGSR